MYGIILPLGLRLGELHCRMDSPPDGLLQNKWGDMKMLQALLLKHGGALRSTLHRLASDRPPTPCFRGNGLVSKSLPRCMFATSCPRSVTKKARSSLKNLKIPSKHTIQATSPAALMPSYKSFAETLAQQRSPTLLFQASSHRGYTITCYFLGGFSFAYSAINFNNQYLHPPEGIWAPIPIAIGGLCVFMTFVGAWFIRRVSWYHVMSRARY